MKAKAAEVFAGLEAHALGEKNAIRAMDLAIKIGLPNKVVSNTLYWLAVEDNRRLVRRFKSMGCNFYRYWAVSK